eukprot:g13961.t1
MKLTKLTKDIGTKIENIDITKPLSNADILTIRQILAERGVVVLNVPNGLTEQEQIAFTSQFGKCIPHPGTFQRWLQNNNLNGNDSKFKPKEVRRIAIKKEHALISSQTKESKEKLKNVQKSRQAGMKIVQKFNYVPKDPRSLPINPNANNETWHSDVSCEFSPPACSCLHMLKAAPDGKGDTLFASMYNVYDRISPALREMLKSMHGVHIERRLGNDWYEMPHPAIIRHPETKRPVVFLNRAFVGRFENFTVKESKPILHYIEKIASSPDNVYRHKWTFGDLVMWDNRCMLHFAVKDYDANIEGQERIVRRTNWYDGVQPSFHPKVVRQLYFPYDDQPFSIETVKSYDGYLPEHILLRNSRL